MYEVEVKVPADPAAVRDSLAARDAEPLGAVTQVDTYFDAPHRDFAETDEALRLRWERPADGPDRSVLTYKGPLVDPDSKTREEIETTVDDGETTRELLAALGFEAAATVRKDRDRYRLEGCTVTLDSVADVGEFVEVEREAEEAEVDEARERTMDVLDSLGLDPAEQVRTSYLELLLESDNH